jgi:hypothetical protein
MVTEPELTSAIWVQILPIATLPPSKECTLLTVAKFMPPFGDDSHSPVVFIVSQFSMIKQVVTKFLLCTMKSCWGLQGVRQINSLPSLPYRHGHHCLVVQEVVTGVRELFLTVVFSQPLPEWRESLHYACRLQVLCAMRCSLQLIRELICLDGILLHFER